MSRELWESELVVDKSETEETCYSQLINSAKAYFVASLLFLFTCNFSQLVFDAQGWQWAVGVVHCALMVGVLALIEILVFTIKIEHVPTLVWHLHVIFLLPVPLLTYPTYWKGGFACLGNVAAFCTFRTCVKLIKQEVSEREGYSQKGVGSCRLAAIYFAFLPVASNTIGAGALISETIVLWEISQVTMRLKALIFLHITCIWFTWGFKEIEKSVLDKDIRIELPRNFAVVGAAVAVAIVMCWCTLTKHIGAAHIPDLFLLLGLVVITSWAAIEALEVEREPSATGSSGM